LTGIKAHTLRIWEQRYNIIKPERSETNIRTYSENELKLLLNISFLNRQGYKISKIAEMSPDEINNLVLEVTALQAEINPQIDQLIRAMVEYNENAFDKVFSSQVLKHGLEKTIVGLIYPFLEQIGILWQTGKARSSHEHFISNLVKQKLYVAIEGQSTPGSGADKFVLFLPENERHEIGLLLSNYIVRSKGNHVIYLGQSVPFNDILDVYNYVKPTYLYSVLTTVPNKDEVQNFIDSLGQKFPKTICLLTGIQVMNKEFELPENVKIFNSIRQAVEFLRQNSTTEYF
jgi:MerR family transcriptional regulator, light-induced transcriptional regulator